MPIFLFRNKDKAAIKKSADRILKAHFEKEKNMRVDKHYNNRPLTKKGKKYLT